MNKDEVFCLTNGMLEEFDRRSKGPCYTIPHGACQDFESFMAWIEKINSGEIKPDGDSK